MVQREVELNMKRGEVMLANLIEDILSVGCMAMVVYFALYGMLVNFGML